MLPSQYAIWIFPFLIPHKTRRTYCNNCTELGNMRDFLYGVLKSLQQILKCSFSLHPPWMNVSAGTSPSPLRSHILRVRLLPIHNPKICLISDFGLLCVTVIQEEIYS